MGFHTLWVDFKSKHICYRKENSLSYFFLGLCPRSLHLTALLLTAEKITCDAHFLYPAKLN